MTALSIRHRNFTMARREQEGLMTLPTDENAGSTQYYWVERKAKRTKDKWLFVRAFWATPERAEEFFKTHYNDGQHRLRQIPLTY